MTTSTAQAIAETQLTRHNHRGTHAGSEFFLCSGGLGHSGKRNVRVVYEYILF